MANLTNIDWSKFAGWDMPVYLNRLNPIPLDKTSIFESLCAATAYAADTTKMAYAGQIISVVEGGKVVVYKVNEDRTLEKVGIGAGSITAENYSAALGLITSGNATLGQIVYLLNEEQKDGKTYPAGTYVVSAVGSNPSLSHLTSEAAGASGLTSRVEGLEAWEGLAKSQISTLEAASHSHDNKTELDKIADGDKAKWDEAYASAHNHSNKAVLDAITSEKVSAWDAAEGNAKAYASAYTDNKLVNYATSADTVAAIKAVDDKFGDYATSAATVAAIKAVDDKVVEFSGATVAAIKAVDDKVVEFSGATVAAIKAVDDKVVEFSGATVAAIKAVDDKFDNYATSAATVAAIKAVDDKFGDYATSAATVAAIDAVKTASVVTVEKLTEAESGFAATYQVKQNGVQVGASINIPKDYLVKSAQVKTCVEDDKPVAGYKVGDKYIDFVVNTTDGKGNEQHIYLKVTELVDVYTGSTYIEINSGNGIEIKYGALSGQLYSDFAIANLATKTDVNTLSGNVVEAIKIVDTKVDNFSAATVEAIKEFSAATVDAVKAVSDKVDELSGATIEAVKAVDEKVDGLSGSVQGIETKLNTAESDIVALKGISAATRIAALEEVSAGTRIAALETKVGDSAVSVQISNAIDSYSAVVYTELDKKVDKVEGSRLMTDAEGVKLSGISAGAQVNVIEAVAVNGVDAVVDGNKKAEVTIDGTKIAVGKDLSDGSTTVSGDTKIDNVLQGIYNRLNGIQSSALTEVIADGSGITVTEKNKVSLKLEAATVETAKAGHVELKVNASGQLYGQMYYIEGDEEN